MASDIQPFSKGSNNERYFWNFLEALFVTEAEPFFDRAFSKEDPFLFVAERSRVCLRDVWRVRRFAFGFVCMRG